MTQNDNIPIYDLATGLTYKEVLDYLLMEMEIKPVKIAVYIENLERKRVAKISELKNWLANLET